MSIIIRDDGTPFVYFTYRESIVAKKASLLKQELRELEQENGRYARFFVQPTGDVEAIFSQEPGYLLAESIWDYLNQPTDMLFCEELPDGEKAILVIVRQGRIFFDGLLPLIQLVDEWLSLPASENPYEIFVYGDHIPLAETPSDEKFAFDSKFVKSFNELDDPLFSRLELDPALQLLPFNQALAELPFGKLPVPAPIIWIVIIAIVGYVAYELFKPAPPPPPPVVQAPVYVPPVDPYVQYKAFMQTPSMQTVLVEFIKQLQAFFTIPGWEPTQVTFSDQVISVNLKSIGGTAGTLVSWVKTHNVVMQASSDSASISIRVNLPNRQPPTKIYNQRDMLVKLFDRMKAMFPTKSISMDATTPMQNFAVTPITFQVTQMSPDMLLILASATKGLSVVFDSCSFTIQNGLLSGTVKIEVVGETTS